jgi:para-aminobenzoate synthetase component 1
MFSMRNSAPQRVLHHVNEALLFARLRTYFGLIWLHDHQNDVIGIAPKWLVLQKNELSLTLFERQNPNLTYAQSAPDGSLDGFLCQRWQPMSCACSTDITFTGGLMGMIGYDHATLQHAIAAPTRTQGVVHSAVGEYDIFLKKQDQGWVLYGTDDPAFASLYDEIEQQLCAPAPLLRLALHHVMQPLWSDAQYQQAFARVQAYLQAGDCYQINLTQAFSAPVHGELLAALPKLHQLTQAPYAGYLRITADDEVLSCSPELFLSFEADRRVVTRPIKGTQPRHQDMAQDEAAKQRLAQSEKDQSENLMIVDLLRNDLSRYAQHGSVKVPKLFEIESFAQVHHLVSDIEAVRRADVSSLEVLLHALPGGSITGAPKIRAMQIISELEVAGRGAYCGSMGYLNYDDTGRWNILIRTIQRAGDQLSVWAGGGITIASDCASEYQECLDKVGAILQTLNEWVCPTTEADAEH